MPSISAKRPGGDETGQSLPTDSSDAQLFLLIQPTIVLIEVDASWIADSLPPGAIITWPNTPAVDERFVDVLVEGRSIRMFAIDLQQRAVPCWQSSVPASSEIDEGVSDPQHSEAASSPGDDGPEPGGQPPAVIAWFVIAFALLPLAGAFAIIVLKASTT